MSSFPSGLDPGRALARRLEQLCATLAALDMRLREAVAAAVGHTLGGLVRDAVWHALGHGEAAAEAALSWPPAHALRDEQSCADEEAFDQTALWMEEREADASPEPADSNPPAKPVSASWPLALVAGLRTACWLAPRRPDRRGLWTAVGLACLVGGLSYGLPALAAASLGLLTAAEQLGLLSAAVPAG